MVGEVVGGIPERFAIAGGRCHRLVPFCGTAPPERLVLEDDAQEYAIVDGVPVGEAIAACDRVLRQVVTRWAVGGGRSERAAYVYEDDTWAVIRTPAGNHFLSRQVPPYVVEAEDRRLYAFPGARLGLRLAGLDPGHRLHWRPLVLHPYRHMFTYDTGLGYCHICMPRDAGYYADLQALPPAEALMQHLESARLALCAGYQPGTAPFHPIDLVRRTTISDREARRRELPIYRFRWPRRWVGRPG